MQLRFTPAGRALFETSPANFTVTRLVLTDAFNYILSDPPTTLIGSVVFDRTANLLSEVENANTLKLISFLDNTIGPFDFGEVGLYSGSVLVAIGVSPTLISKLVASGSDNGNHLALNLFVSQSNSNSFGFVKLSNSDSRYQLGQVLSVDYLDPPYEGDPNVYVVNGLTATDMPVLAFSDVNGKWAFSNRNQTYYSGVVTTSTQNAVDVAVLHNVAFGSPSDYVLQFVSGRLRGYCRQCTNIGATFFQWNVPTLYAPEDGDRFIVVGPSTGSGASNALTSRVTTLEGQMTFVLANLGGGGAVAPTYTAPSVTLTSVPAPTLVEYGDSLSIQFSNAFSQNNAGSQSSTRLRRNNAVISNAFPYTDVTTMGLSSLSYDSQVTYADGPILNDSLGNPYPLGRILTGTVTSAPRVFQGSRKSFYGTPSATPINSNAIRALTSTFTVTENPQVDANGGDLVGTPTPSFTINIPIGATRVVFAYPDTVRNVSSVRYQELSNVEVKSNFLMTNVSVEGANAFAPTGYKVWTYVPVEPFSSPANYKVYI